MPSPYPPISSEIIDDISSEAMFASADWRVICREGENYYKACGEVVYEFEEGGNSTCIKPLYHRTWDHEDFDGRVKDSNFGPPADMEWQTRDFIQKALRRTGLNNEQVYNALNALYYHNIKMERA